MTCIASLSPFTVGMMVVMVPSIAVLLTGYTTSEWEVLGNTHENYTTSGLWETCTTNIGISTTCNRIPTSEYTDLDYHIRIWTSLGLVLAVISFWLTAMTFIAQPKYRWRLLGPAVVILVAASVFISAGLLIYSDQSNKFQRRKKFGFSLFCVGASVFGFFLATILACCDLCGDKQNQGIVDYSSLGPDYGTNKPTQPAKPDSSDLGEVGPEDGTATATEPENVDRAGTTEVPDQPGDMSQPDNTNQPDNTSPPGNTSQPDDARQP